MEKDVKQKKIEGSSDTKSRSISNGMEAKMQAKIYNQKGAEVGNIKLPAKVF